MTTTTRNLLLLLSLRYYHWLYGYAGANRTYDLITIVLPTDATAMFIILAVPIPTISLMNESLSSEAP